MRHKIVIQNLYEFLAGGVSESDRKAIEGHLAWCGQCTRELDALRNALEVVPRNIIDPAKNRPELYWQLFADKVQKRALSATDEQKSSWQDLIMGWIGHRRSFVVGFGSAIALTMLTVSIWQLLSFKEEDKAIAFQQGLVSAPGIHTVSLEARTQDYLERSKILLVGLVNADTETPVQSNMTFGKQREVSRELVHESRELTAALSEPSQQRLRRLISDLELILIQIADIEEQNDSPAIELVKSGLERRNVLFKINLEELQRPGRVTHESIEVQNQKGS